ncbi:M1 family aminopeptidase [Thermofilum pendens]|uniref:Peptidase M1, membrane alanine aminopeptidase n=1 Tax=Thermofilum pendens (strain DSM 2475 / Hrk 5) TaxID=368408 RepID=A1RZJ3_THEPD|nr:M1 family aminopeptidase [Thermofilum pendens]ABL78623.1 peptidase M1, membrane alanine aminopeptidase [Thermofilum pendens Hrk 5]
MVTVKTGRGFAYPEYEPVWPPEPPFELLEVRAEVDVDFESRTLRGVCVNRLKVTAPAERVVFHAVDMKIEEVLVNGRKAAYTYDGRELSVGVEGVGAGGEVEVYVRYATVEPKAGAWFVPVDGGKPYMVYTQGQPEDTRYWLPTYDYPNRKAKVSLAVTVPKGIVVVANGVLVGREELGDKERWSFRLDSRIPTYLIAFAAGDFSVVEEEYGGVKLQYVVPRGREGDIPRSFSQTKEMVRFFEEFTGVKYPYPKYAQVCVDEFVAGGMENASVTILTSATLHDEKAHADFRSEPLVSHELAHQWFGDLVTCRDWSHLWLNESFATLMEALWRRRELGEEEFVYDLIGMLDSYLSEYGKYARPIVTRLYKYPDEVFDAHSYPKGALVLWTLMNIVGEEAFRRGVKKYLESRREDNAVTDDLRRALEEASGARLDWFFEQYVFNAGHPALSVSYKWVEKEGVLELRVSQTQGDDSLPRYRVPLEVEFLGEGFRERRTVWVEERQSVFSFRLPSKPTAVCVDPSFKAFKALSLDLGVEELLSIVKHCPYLYPRVAAVRELAKKASPTAVEELKGLLLSEDEFWGLRSEVASAIGSIGGQAALNALLEALDKVRHPKVRRAIVRALGGYREKAVAERLSKVLKDESESYYVRAEAALSIAKTGFREYSDALKEALNVPSHNHVIAASALEALAMLLGDEVLDLLEKYASPSTPMPLRRAAIASLGYLPPSQRVLSLLEYSSRSRHPHVKLSVISACTRLLSPRVLPILERLQGDTSGRVARSARDAAEQIKKHMERGEEYRKLKEELDKLREEERRLSERVERLEKR